MRYAIISDIHGNREALDAVLSDIRREGADAVVCLGDLIGYGPDPNEVVDRVREKSEVVIAGNHDSAAVIGFDLYDFNPYARASLDWTREVLTPENRRYLGDLKIVANLPDVLLVHATPCMPREWRYLATIQDVEENFMAFGEKVCFVGHSHMPLAIQKNYDGSFRFLREESVELEEGSRYIVNVGSVGQPRDGDPRASYALYDSRAARIAIRRVAYGYQATQEKMRRVRLPGYLVTRLEAGR